MGIKCAIPAAVVDDQIISVADMIPRFNDCAGLHCQNRSAVGIGNVQTVVVGGTLPVGLANLYEIQRYATDWGALFAALVLALIPTVILFIVGQKQLVQGLSVGGVKG